MRLTRRRRGERPRAAAVAASGAQHHGPASDFRLYGRLLREARSFWPHLGALLLLSLAASPLALLTPVPLKVAVDSVIGSHPLPGFLAGVLPPSVESSRASLLWVAASLFILVTLLQQLQKLASAVLSAYAGEKLVLGLRAKLFNRIQRLSLAYHDSQGTADSTYRIQYDALAIQKLAVDSLMPFVTAIFTIVGMLYVTARIDWQLGVVAVAVSPILAGSSWIYRNRVRPKWRTAKQLDSSALSVVQEVLTGLRVVKAFGQEHREEKRFVDRSSQGVRARIRLTAVQGVFSLGVGLTTAMGSAAVLYIGVRHVQSGRLTVGELLLVMSYLLELYKPLETSSNKAASLQSALASAERAFAMLDAPAEVPERPHARPLARAAGAVAFEDVSFAYDADRPVLRGVSFQVEPGTRVGISGTTGAGKTTLVSLLTRFYDPTAGRILLDGIDVRDYRLADLRRQFAIVLQEPVLFSTSIAENIGYARPEATGAELVAAAKAANIHDFIAQLPEGYDTQVGERGMRLSGGERQRMSLARAFLKDAPILILDEPTSSVDVRTEAAIMDAMDRLMQGRTSFMIAHRVTTLATCGVRLEVEDGRVSAEPLPSQPAPEAAPATDGDGVAAGMPSERS